MGAAIPLFVICEHRQTSHETGHRMVQTGGFCLEPQRFSRRTIVLGQQRAAIDCDFSHGALLWPFVSGVQG
jgi:hypothetical protein